jgi:hypothetical protein
MTQYDDDVIIFKNAASGSANGALTWSERMRITSGGNVGIGTSSPTAYTGFTTLQVNGTSGTNGGVFRSVSFDGTKSFNIYANADGAIFNTTSAIPFIFLTQDTERMRITSGGQIYNSNAPANDWVMKLTGSTTTGQSYGLRVQAGTNASDVAVLVANSANTTDLFAIVGDGRAVFSSSIKTGAPTSGTAKPWKLGARIANTCTVSTSAYLEVEVDGTLHYLAFANPS